MGWQSMISPGSTSAAGSIIYLQDGADFLGYINHVQTAANPTVIMQSVNLPDDGYISSADNQALNLYLSSALTAGTVKIMVWGYEI